MAGYDAADALDDIFEGLDDDSESPEGTEGTEGTAAPEQDDDYQSGEMAAVAARTESILAARPTEPVDLVVNLARGLPNLDDVREVPQDDTSELTETEQQQKDQTEDIIRAAVASGEASIWVIAEGLQRAAKGRWWRRTHDTYAAYIHNLTGRSASYVRRLRAGAPLALETAARTGLVQNPGQNREAVKAEQQYGQDAAILLFQVVAEVTEELGDKVTAEAVAAAREQLPAVLPELPEQKRAEIERSTRRALGQGVPIDTPVFEGESNGGVPIGTPNTDDDSEQPPQTEPETEPEASGSAEVDDDIPDAEIVPESIVALKDAITVLNALNRAVTKDTFAQAAKEADAHEYADLRAKLLTKATSFQKKALHAPLVYGDAPMCGTCGTAAAPSPAEAKLGKPGTYWWCEICQTTQGARSPF
ncbi:hypothetical protein [Streptomyces albipurpureus]|uniref:Uncharacterized protein n=1 Tax=Streptomyces albipurpureus TaxID=2897419 RepID=A0ABT0V0R2_9ACTN|nr:hypothetical protein [Streptomyces sp. CWNU-1]MCM2394335.1 hypothetical protein [Streptomyces sp. CWNU-1]